MNYEIEVIDAEVDALLKAVRTRLSRGGIHSMFNNVTAPYLQQRIDERFSSEGDDVTGPWAQLRFKTRGIRRSLGYGAAHPINRRSGALYRFVKTYHIASQTLTMPGRTQSTKLEDKLRVAQLGGYARNSGTSRAFGPSAPTVPRPVVGLNNRDRVAITTQLQGWVEASGKVIV